MARIAFEPQTLDDASYQADAAVTGIVFCREMNDERATENRQQAVIDRSRGRQRRSGIERRQKKTPAKPRDDRGRSDAIGRSS